MRKGSTDELLEGPAPGIMLNLSRNYFDSLLTTERENAQLSKSLTNNLPKSLALREGSYHTQQRCVEVTSHPNAL